ncbi:alpha/beta fold hydrolase [Gordonia sp. LSe1-13]|uniref:Alpha/beta fold hydrolase n=1 Tax=Gordonia sesuvii TaxID=3116777 RepID=A0ABU7M932_9ACTN|nr:alpha/beta fold hydrolase [Gordonia sp. LSe1-13]
MTRTDRTFASGTDLCEAWYFTAHDERLASAAGRPIVVMAHGFGGTKDSGLEPFAERFRAAGLDVLAFDYRGFGRSAGSPRQSISIRRQIEDYQSAVDAARSTAGVDPDRVVLWGSSLSGGHVMRVAADDGNVAAVIALTPMTNAAGAATATRGLRELMTPLRWLFSGLRSRLRVSSGARPITMPIVGPPGTDGAMTAPGAYESYLAIAGPSWRNEIDTSVGLEIAGVRTTDAARRLRCRLLVQIADFDRYFSPHVMAKTAVLGRAQVHHYPCDHFDVWPHHDWFDHVVDDQVAFLIRALADTDARTVHPPGL